MKLYYAPGACSLADHIALREAGLAFDLVRVDLKAHRTADGDDYHAVNPKGYVPALTLDDGETLTENIAILDWVAAQSPTLRPGGERGRTHLLEALAFISTELHKGFAPFFKGASDADKAKAADLLGKRFEWIAGQLKGDYLFGDTFSVADAYLFTMLTWADRMDVAVPDALRAYRSRVSGREAVGEALVAEGIA